MLVCKQQHMNTAVVPVVKGDKLYDWVFSSPFCSKTWRFKQLVGEKKNSKQTAVTSVWSFVSGMVAVGLDSAAEVFAS